ncbi:MAG TPA: class I SAM-dependent rRNA methyltransferase [Prolixibacteraceae bacterium]|nr:class I SAM-dependent rRNA methyltransferase [Prolixibacteraceae bacterium]
MADFTSTFHLKKGKEQSVKRFHPWIFSGAISRMDGRPDEGDIVRVLSFDGAFLGFGHYQIGSISVRLFSFRNETIDNAFWCQKIRQAFLLRKALGLTDSLETTAYRLVYAEGDGLPGLIVDVYGPTAVMQCHTVGMYRLREKLALGLKEVMGSRLEAVYDKSAKTIPFKAGIDARDGFIFGTSIPGLVKENGLSFRVDWEEGQKTGFFIDQRDNRFLLQSYASGRDVLNMFCYTGGFSFSALQGGARSVHSVDSSEKAIALTRENVDRNFPGDKRHQAFVADAFDFMKDKNDRYDLIVLDPPAFAKHRDAVHQALQGYKRLNAKAFEQIRPGGIVFTFSCSQVVSKERFREAVFSGAVLAGRSVKMLHQLGHPPDHPVDLFHPEGEYLKGLVLFVE